jgi:hypothetical protein
MHGTRACRGEAVVVGAIRISHHRGIVRFGVSTKILGPAHGHYAATVALLAWQSAGSAGRPRHPGTVDQRFFWLFPFLGTGAHKCGPAILTLVSASVTYS